MNPTLAMSLALALAIPETPENFRVVRELVGVLQALVNREEDSDD